MKVMAIEKREDVSPEEGKSKYGDVKFADEKNKKYPLDTEAHVRAALSYWGMPKNRSKYSADDQATIGGRIRAAAKRLGIETSDDDGDDKKAESSLVYAAATVDLDGQTPSEIVFMPCAEEITITPVVGGRSKPVQLKVDASVAEVLQSDLTKRLNDPIRPFAGFDHKPGAASFLPKAFKWDEERGVILEVDWTQKGKDDVAGRNYSYFSPTFMLSGKKVAGLPNTGEVGSLTNNPAFRTTTMKIAASADDDEGENEMVKLRDKLVELEVITAEQAADADEELLVSAVTGMYQDLKTVYAANARLESANTALAAKVKDVEKAEAQTVIQAAIAEGKIGAKDQTSIDFYLASFIASPETTKKVLASMPRNPLLQKVIDVKVSDTKRVAQGQSEADLVQAQHLAIHEIQEAHPNLSYPDAFNKARRDRPEIFPAEV